MTALLDWIRSLNIIPAIHWDTIDGHWWTLPLEVVIVVYCFIGFHIVSNSHLLPSLDAFCRKWNISLETAQPTIYALGGVAPIIITSNVAFLSDIAHRSATAHRLGICGIIGFGITTASLIPSFAVFSLVGHITLPLGSIFRDHMFVMILLATFLIIIITARVMWWQSVIICCLYIMYVVLIVLYPKLKAKFGCPARVNSILNHLGAPSESHANQAQTAEESYLKFESAEMRTATSPLLSSHIKHHDILHAPSERGPSNYSLSPDRKSLQSNRSSLASLRHPMLMSEYDPDFPLIDDGFPIDIAEFENESQSITEEVHSDVHKIHLSTPKGQKSVFHMYPSIHFESLKPGQGSQADLIHDGGQCVRERLALLFSFVCGLYIIVSFPLRICIKYSIPSSAPLSRFEFLYPIALIMSCVWLFALSFVLVVIVYHCCMLHGWSLPLVGLLFIGPLAALPNLMDCVTLSLQGFAAEITANCYHIQISNIFFGIIVPLLVSSLLDAINAYQHYVKEGVILYLVVMLCQEVVLFSPLLVGLHDIEFTRPKGWVYVGVYVVSIVCFCYVSFLP